MQSASGQFLPHDIQYLGMTAEQLCSFNQCKVVHIMFHDRVSFGGTIIAIGIMYLWLAEFPLKARQPWAWWTFAASGSAGFLSFLSYLGYGYLDAITPRPIPLLAHARAGFGGGVCSGGLALFLSIWCSPSTRNLWQALLLAAISGFSTAIAIHPLIGYTNLLHLTPAYLGALL